MFCKERKKNGDMKKAWRGRNTSPPAMKLALEVECDAKKRSLILVCLQRLQPRRNSMSRDEDRTTLLMISVVKKHFFIMKGYGTR